VGGEGLTLSTHVRVGNIDSPYITMFAAFIPRYFLSLITVFRAPLTSPFS